MTFNTGYWMTVYFRDSTAQAIEGTLERMGALRERHTQDGWMWTLDPTDRVAELHMIDDWDSYAIELVGEPLEMTIRRAEVLGGEPTVACIINRKDSPAGAHTTQRIVTALLNDHCGFADDERRSGLTTP